MAFTPTRKKSENFSHNPNYLEGLYDFGDELGSGGFGKVKLAVHKLTGEKVAIKIIDKKAVGDDLPRVTTELQALKSLAHQNICRMYQFVETAEKFYIIMEYCNGGEMFDYIVRKDKLEESEARHFFRQLVVAMAYVHSNGIAHRDLKPENLLLKEDLQLKVIDFGLCARPPQGLSQRLKTCCGSPAYAAPELIQNKTYFGNEADVWSMGVLLYALLCGALPFEDESLPRLYKKISAGVYHEPKFLSQQSKELLRSMLSVNPQYRIRMSDLLTHPWLLKNFRLPLKWRSVYDRDVVDDDVAREMAFCYGMDKTKVINLIKEWKFDYLTATYLILLQKKEKNQNFSLPILRKPGDNVANSPTLHGSLEKNLHEFGISKKSIDQESRESLFDGSYVKAIEYGSSTGYGTPTRKPATKTIDLDTGSAKTFHNQTLDCRKPENKENRRPSIQPPSMRTRNPLYENRTSTYATPKRAPISTSVYSPAPVYRRPQSIERTGTTTHNAPASEPRPRNFNSSEQSSYVSRFAEKEDHSQERQSRQERQPRSTERESRSVSKTARRVYASLERKADKMINYLTPRKMRTDVACTPKRINNNNLANVSTTSSKDPEQILEALMRVFNELEMNTTVKGWKISGTKPGPFGGAPVIVELEVVLTEISEFVGVRRRRVTGEAFLYKKVCEEVLNLAGI